MTPVVLLYPALCSLRHTSLGPSELVSFIQCPAQSNIVFDKSYLIAWPHLQLSISAPCSPPKLNAKLNVPTTCFYTTFYIPLLYNSALCIKITCEHISPQKNELYHILPMLIRLAPSMVPNT